jgi:hypothetical protein
VEIVIYVLKVSHCSRETEVQPYIAAPPLAQASPCSSSAAHGVNAWLLHLGCCGRLTCRQRHCYSTLSAGTALMSLSPGWHCAAAPALAAPALAAAGVQAPAPMLVLTSKQANGEQIEASGTNEEEPRVVVYSSCRNTADLHSRARLCPIDLL